MSHPLEQHRQAYAYCAYCPKVCRFACPVSDSTKNETTSTWGKMTSAFLAATGMKKVEATAGEALYACTGCMRCRSFCAHENEVGWALFSARKLALDAKAAPEAARSTAQAFAQHQNPFGRDLGEALARFKTDSPVRYQLFPGCSSVAKAPEVVEDAVAIGTAFSMPVAVGRVSARCCGYPLYAAGATDAFAEHAARFAETLRPYPELVVMDPGCAYTMKVVYPRAGVELPNVIRTIYEVLAESLGHAPVRPALAERFAYHDACHLGRGLGIYEAPRKLLERAAGRFAEARENRGEAHCSGGGGLVPRTMPETSVDIARRGADRIAEDGETVVTACPTSKRMFERAGRKAEHLLSVLRRWVLA